MPLTLYNRNQKKRPFGEIMYCPTFDIVEEKPVEKEHWFKRLLKAIWKILNWRIF
jgi:hypothetical protein